MVGERGAKNTLTAKIANGFAKGAKTGVIRGAFNLFS
jgi:hypothetical protein